MKPLLLLIFITISLSVPSKAQHQNNYWCFGSSAGLNFNTTPPSPITSSIFTFEGCATISDPGGKLLFYTDGRKIWDRKHMVMPNGTGLMGGFSSTQSALIVPLPNSVSKYYIFTTQDYATDGGLSYSVVDMNLNGGFGDLIIGNKNILVIDQTSEKVTSVLHANGIDVWIITHTLSSNEFLAYLLTSSGLSATPVISIIGAIYPSDGFPGPIKPSHHGQKIAASCTNAGIAELFDFNSSNGVISNSINLNDFFNEYNEVYGIEFSPNDSLLYISTSNTTTNNIFQIDFFSGQVIILNSSLLVFGALQKGPDQKIYLSRSGNSLDVIHKPDQKGFECNYEESGINLKINTSAFYGLPAYNVYSFFTPFSEILGSDTTLCEGSTIDLHINISKDCDPISILWNDGSSDLVKTFDQPGIYWVEVESKCGHIVDTIHIDYMSCEPLVYYDLEACLSNMQDGTNMDYSELIPAYPTILPCADISATNVFRAPPQANKHSCTPGVNESTAMCISSHPSCTYAPGHQASLVSEIEITPQQDSNVLVTGFTFYEKAPPTFSWINGGTGPNNYPTKFGIRILKNGNEIYRNEEILTTQSWSLKSFDFRNDSSFRINEPTLFRIELLPYCPVGNGADVSAWDIDEITLSGGCIPHQNLNSTITGFVYTEEGEAIPRVEMQLAENPSFTNKFTSHTDVSGAYLFEQLDGYNTYFLKGYKNDDVLNGVSAIDLILIQKHLLGISPFTSLHQYIAADVNHSGTVNALDLVALQKLLLGISTEFPGNTSWRFGYLPQDMSGDKIGNFKEIYNNEYFDPDAPFINFVGIKVGDLNGDVKLD